MVPCALDIATTPRRFFDLPSKRTWLVVAVAFWAFGATAWLVAGRAEVRARRSWEEQADRWLARRPAPGPGRSGHFLAPDDNPAFLLELDQRIRGWREGV